MLQLIKLLSLRITEFLAEVAGIVTSRERLKQLWHVRFYSNAFYMVIANATGALFGFVFWIVAARLYSPEDVGLAAALIAAVGLLMWFCDLGLGWGLIRFLSHSGENTNAMINTVLTTRILFSIVVALIFIAGLGFWSPALLFIRSNPTYLTAFILFTVALALFTSTGDVFIARRRAGFNLVSSLIASPLRLLLLLVFPLVAFSHTSGIFAAWGISFCVAVPVGILLFLPRAQPGYRLRFTFNLRIIKEIISFSFANYIAGFFWGASALVLPLMVVNLLGAAPNAYFYIAWAIASVPNMIIGATSMSLFAEGSYEEERLGPNIWRSLKMTYLIIVPTVILILVIAPKLLLLFGGSYSDNATTLLRILAISALPLAINSVYLATKRVEKKLRVIIGLTAFAAALTLGLAYLLLPRMGINGAGIAWLTSQGVIALVVVASWLKTGRRAHTVVSSRKES